jgi:hypothetical protein
MKKKNEYQKESNKQYVQCVKRKLYDEIERKKRDFKRENMINTTKQ